MTGLDVDTARPRLDALTGLRWLAAFWVFGYHMLNFGSPPAPVELVNRLGFLGVTFFFVLSGFVLTRRAPELDASRREG